VTTQAHWEERAVAAEERIRELEAAAQEQTKAARELARFITSRGLDDELDDWVFSPWRKPMLKRLRDWILGNG
jgi:hypothetical protein